MAQKVLVEEHRGIEDKRPWPACCRGAVCLCRVVVPVGGGSNIPIGVVEIIYLAILYVCTTIIITIMHIMHNMRILLLLAGWHGRFITLFISFVLSLLICRYTFLSGGFCGKIG